MKPIIILILLYIIQAEHLLAKNYYVYIDQNGNKVFTDRIPNNRDFTRFRQSQLTTTKWLKNTTTILMETNKKPNRLATDDKKQQCKKLADKIRSLENKLSKRLKPEEFEKLKQQLSEQRWSLRKRCH